MDFITSLHVSEDKDSTFVIIDQLTKYVPFTRISSKAKAWEIAKNYVKNVYRLDGFPKVIVRNKDPKFTSDFWKELFYQMGTTLTLSTLYHPRTKGQTKVVNK
jgi:hypothetical protein